MPGRHLSRWYSILPLLAVLALPATLAAQEAPMSEGNGLVVYTIPSVDPNRPSSSGPYPVTFWVVNTGAVSRDVYLTCSVSGPLTCANVNPTSAGIDPGDSAAVSLTYSTTSGTGAGSVILTAEMDGVTPPTSSGARTVTVVGPGAGVIALVTRNQDNLDRGLCLTVGAGEAAGLSCGDLITTAGLPAYRTLGRDRSLGLHYNSATATGLNLIAARVAEPATIAMPTSIRVVLAVNGTHYDSTSYAPPGSYGCGFVGCVDTFQVVVGRSLNWAGLPTGAYPYTLTLRNVYPSAVHHTTVTGQLLVVNRSASEYGRGWGLLGVEQVLTPADTTQRVWVAGDGSARVFHRGAGVTSGQLSHSGLTSFSAANSVDGSLVNTAWTTSGSTGTSAYVRADLGAVFPQAVTSARLYALNGNNATYDVQYSSNGTSWTTVLAGFKPQAGWSSVVWSSVGAYRYWQLKVANNNAASSTIRELSFGSANNFYAAPGDAPDSLVRFDTLCTPGCQRWYRRELKHGARVTLDPAGRHQLTTNRVGAITSFHWSAITPIRLDSVTVPPNSTPRRTYRLFWDGTTRLLDSIRDPGGRRLRTVMTSGNLTKLVAPGNLDSTRFAYDARNVMVKRIATRQKNSTKGDSAVTTFSYANNARVTQVAVQADSAGTQNAISALSHWDEKGLATLMRSDTAPYGLSTRVDGPLTGLGDAADFWLNRFGAPTRTLGLGLNALTQLYRDSTRSLPALVTRVDQANGHRVRMAWNQRGNLVQVRDSTCRKIAGCSPAMVDTTTYEYNDSDAPDSPSRVLDALGRATQYAYGSNGLLDLVTDPRGHLTQYWYTASGALKGMVDSIAEKQVETARYPHLDFDELLDQTVRFTYDANGNVHTRKEPVGITHTQVADSLGRVLATYDPYGARKQYLYDALNRVTQVTQDSAEVNPPGVNPWAGCDPLQVDCYSTDVLDPNTGPTLITTWYHGSAGLDSVVDPRGVARRYRYDVAGRVVRELDEFLQESRAEFSTAGQLLRRLGRVNALVPTRDTVRFVYDSVGRQVGMRLHKTFHPMVGDTVTGDSVDYTYDVMGRRTFARNRRGEILRSYYPDGLLRTQVTVYGTGRDSAAHDYDASGARTRLSRSWASGGTTWTDITTFAYASNGDLQSISAQWGAPLNSTSVVSFTWDGLGRRRTMTYPGNIVVTYRYDAAGLIRRLTSVNPANPGSGADNLDFTVQISTADALGRARLRVTTCGGQGAGNPCGATNGSLSVSSNFDRYGWLASQNSTPGPDETYRYDKSGNRTARVIAGSVLDHHYRYATVPGGGATNVLAADSVEGEPASTVIKMQNNGNGSRVREYFGLSSEERLFYYDALGRNTGVRDYDHYTSGNMDCTQWDAEGRMIHPCPDGTPRAIYDGENVAALDAERWVFVHGPGLDDPLLGLLRLGGNSQLYFYVTDGRGQQLAVATPNGALSGNQENDYLGKGGAMAGGTQHATTFAGSRLETPTAPGVSYFRNRTYDQTSGRWLQEDPIGIAGGLNLYQYNGNDPVSNTDPFGLAPCPPLCPGLATAAAGAAGGLMTLGAGTSATVGLGAVATAAPPVAVAGALLAWATLPVAQTEVRQIPGATVAADATSVQPLQRDMTKLEKAFVTVMSIFSLTTGGPKIRPPDEKKVPPPPTPIEQPAGPGGPPRPARPFRIEGLE